MIRYQFRWAFLLTLLFLLPVALIRAQPYDDSELRAFLAPPAGCPAPCFMGIRPGEITVEEAIVILEDHEWVASAGENYVSLMRAAVDYGVSPLTATLVWEWSVNKPDWINADRSSYLVVGNSQIVAITVQTNILLGDVLVTYGIPDHAQLVWSNSDFLGHAVTYYAGDGAGCMRIDAGGASAPIHVYRQPVQIQIQQPGAPDPDALPKCGR